MSPREDANSRLLGNPHLTAEETTQLRINADNLSQVIDYVERNKLIDDASAAFHSEKREFLDAMIALIGSIQGRLGAKTWEV